MQPEHRLSALLQLHLHSQLNTWLQWIGQRQLQGGARITLVLEFGASYIRDFTVLPGRTRIHESYIINDPAVHNLQWEITLLSGMKST